MPETITITDDRTGKTVTVPIEGGVFPASAIRGLDPSLFVYDPNDSKKLHPKVVEVWRGPSAYSGMDTDGEFVMFEGGATYRYASVMIVKTNLTTS